VCHLKKEANEKFLQGITAQVQKSGWMTEDLLEWIKSVWFQLSTLLCQQSMLVLDSF
jgi:hypothetical protein